MSTIRFNPAGVETSIQALPPDPDLACDPGSILIHALQAGVKLDHSCGGLAACATCHCYVVQGADTMAPPAKDELAMLERAIARRPESRLACQAIPDGTGPVVVEVPPE